MFMTFLEVKHGLLGIVIIAVGVLALLIAISGVHLLGREIGRSLRRDARMPSRLRKPRAKERVYAGAGD